MTVQRVKSDEVVELPIDALIVSFGFSTNNKNLRNWNVDYKRSSITVNAQFETSQEGVYAIGGAAEYDGKIDLIAVGMGEALLLSTKLFNILNQTVRIVRFTQHH